MTKRTRLFVAIAAGILMVGLGTGLLASYMGVQNLTLIGGNGPAEFAYVPSDARALAFADVRSVMDSDLRRKIVALHPGTDHSDQFLERTGINIDTDIDSVVAAVTADLKGPPLVLARGRFDLVRIEGLVREEGGVVEDYKSIRLVAHDDFALAFVEPGMLALGTPATVRRAIDTKLAGGNVTTNDELMKIVRDVDNGTVWGVARLDALSGVQIPTEVRDRLPAINWFSVTGVINGGVEGRISAEARDDESAQNLRQVIQGFVALGRMQIGPNLPEVNDFINSLQLTGQGRTVSLGFSVPSSMIDALSGMRAGRRPGSAQPTPEAEPSKPEPAPAAL